MANTDKKQMILTHSSHWQERRDREKLGKPEISIEVWFKFKVTIRFKVKVRVRFKVRIKFKGKVRVRNKFKFNSFCVG